MSRLRGAWQQPERGSIAPAIPIVALVLLLLGGLVIDASRQLNLRGQAVAFAEEAARAGAQAVQQNEAGEPELDPQEVGDLVLDYCAHVRARGTVTQCRLVRVERAEEGTARPFTVVTETTMRIDASLLAMVGVRELRASGFGRAEPAEGELDVVNTEP